MSLRFRSSRFGKVVGMGALHIAKSEKELDVIRVSWSNHPRGRWFASGTIVLVSILLWMIPKRRLSGAD